MACRWRLRGIGVQEKMGTVSELFLNPDREDAGVSPHAGEVDASSPAPGAVAAHDGAADDAGLVAPATASAKPAPPAAPYEPSANLIVDLLVKEGLVSNAKLRHAQRIQARLETPQPLLRILQELGVVSEMQIRSTLRAHPHSMRLGALLVELGHLREADIEAALAAQSKSGERKKLGELLIEQHLISEQRLTEILADLLGLEFVEPRAADIDKALIARIVPRVCIDGLFIPVRRADGKTVVAFGDPLDSAHITTARQMLGGEVVAAIARKSMIREALVAVERGQLAPTQIDEQTTVAAVNAILREAIRLGASDIHFEPMRTRLRVRVRIDGVMVDLKEIGIELVPAITSRLKVLSGADIAEKRRHQGGRILFEDVQSGLRADIRASFFVTVFGEKIVLRLLSRRAELLSIDDIGMGPRMLERFRMDALDVPTGVIIITGPTGSGKTTTLYSAVDYLNDAETSIITAEDPVEYVIEGVSQCSINPKINLTFEETLRHIVRQDPDIIVLGEIRDKFSAETAIQAALTGHKVLTTFHTEDSIGGLLRLMNMEIETFLISSTVVSVLAQRLLRKVCSKCGQPHTPTAAELRRLGVSLDELRGAAFLVGRGCDACRFTGYTGRICVFELLVLNEIVKDAILGRKTSYEIRRLSIESSGLTTLQEDGLFKAAAGITTLDEVLRNLPRVTKPRSLTEIRRLLGNT